jgi:hypothetical protein
MRFALSFAIITHFLAYLDISEKKSDFRSADSCWDFSTTKNCDFWEFFYIEVLTLILESKRQAIFIWSALDSTEPEEVFRAGKVICLMFLEDSRDHQSRRGKPKNTKNWLHARFDIFNNKCARFQLGTSYHSIAVAHSKCEVLLDFPWPAQPLGKSWNTSAVFHDRLGASKPKYSEILRKKRKPGLRTQFWAFFGYPRRLWWSRESSRNIKQVTLPARKACPGSGESSALHVKIAWHLDSKIIASISM